MVQLPETQNTEIQESSFSSSWASSPISHQEKSSRCLKARFFTKFIEMQILLYLKLTREQMFDLGSAFPHFIGRQSHLGLCCLDLIHSTALIDVGKGCYKLLLRQNKRNQMFMYNYAFVQSRGQGRAEAVKRKSAFSIWGRRRDGWIRTRGEGTRGQVSLPSLWQSSAGTNKSQTC